MIAFAGTWRLDGAPAKELAERQLRVLNPGGVQPSLWSSPSFAVGILPLVAGDSASLEVAGSLDRRLVVAADARLDNRLELAKRLGLEPGEATAAAVILSAYARWGEEAPRHLQGDFAFVAWDEAAQALLLARDPFGVRPLFYHYAPGRLFAFASRLQALRTLPEVPKDINRAWIVAFLTAEFSDTQATSCTHIRRLRPGHVLRLDRSGERSWEYWALDPDREAPKASFAEYAEGFRHHFLRAVERCLEPPGPVGALLSGGLDSSGIAAAARQIIPRERLAELPTFSTVFETIRKSDEREYMEVVLAESGYRNRRIVGDAMSPLLDLEAVFDAHYEPVHGPNLHLHRAMWAAARDEGCRVILDGLDGDTTVSHGFKLLGELARRGNLPRYFREAWGVSQHFNSSFPRLAYRHLLGPIRSRLQPGRQRPPADLHLILRPEVRAEYQAMNETQLDLEGRVGRCPSTEEHYRRLRSGLLAHVFEQATVDAAQFALEARFPFCDRDLVEYCLSLPAEAKLRNGWSRAVMREGLTGILPEKVRLRGGKAKLGYALRRGLIYFERDRITTVLTRNKDRISEYVDLDELDNALRKFLDGVEGAEMAVWRCLVIALWWEWRDQRSAQH